METIEAKLDLIFSRQEKPSPTELFLVNREIGKLVISNEDRLKLMLKLSYLISGGKDKELWSRF